MTVTNDKAGGQDRSSGVVEGLFSKDHLGGEFPSATTLAKPAPVIGTMDPGFNIPVTRKEEKETPKFTLWEIIASISAYCVVSVSMTVYSKYIVTYYRFTNIFLLLGLQGMFCALILATLKMFGIIRYRDLNRHDVIQWLPAAIGLMAMRYTGTFGIHLLKVSTYTILRNLTIILMALGDYKFFNRRITPLMIVSFILIIASSVMNAYGEPPRSKGNEMISNTTLGYLLAILHAFAAAGYGLITRRTIHKMRFKDIDTTFYNSFLTIVPFIVLSLLTENWSGFIDRYFGPQSTWTDIWQLSFFVLSSSLLGLSVGYTSAWCIRVVSSTTFSIIGSLNKLPLSVSGMLFWKEEREIPLINLFSILIAALGGLTYSYSHWRLSKAKRKEALEGA